MATLTVTRVPLDGGLVLEDNDVPASGGGDLAPVGPNRFLFVKNADASSHTVTLATPGTVQGLDVENPAVVVGAGKSAVVPLPRLLRGSNGMAALTYDAVTSVTVAVLELEA
ncbi:MAG: hypothetical protein HOY78_32380 [Saccharothrix sp.]|nr:hypothetical protein [Saccharothrix sp.]